MSRFVEGIVDKTMTVPGLYNLVQKVIAGPLHRRVGELIASQIPDVEGKRVLDVGCGLGNYSSLFASARYTGFDLDARYIDYANRTFKRSNTVFLVGDAVSPPQFSEPFDHIFSVGLYHHVSDEDTVASLKHIQALLAHGGSMLIFDAVYPRNMNIPGYMLRRLDRGKHVRTFGAYKELLEAFEPVYVDYHTSGLVDFIAFKISGNSGVA